MESRAIAVILAAGEGKRMHSVLPKVLHRLGGKALIEHVVETSFRADMVRTVVVVGHRRDLVIEALSSYPIEFVIQEPQRGTGHAMQQVADYIGPYGGTLAVLLGDAPFIRPATLRALLDHHEAEGNAITMLTAELDDPGGYGRMVRGADGQLERIVEESDASPEERAIREINSGIGCFRYQPMCRALAALDDDNQQTELYLTDTIAILRGEGERVGAWQAEDSVETWGINDFRQLRMAEALYQERAAAALPPPAEEEEEEEEEEQPAAGEGEAAGGFDDGVYHTGPGDDVEAAGTAAGVLAESADATGGAGTAAPNEA